MADEYNAVLIDEWDTVVPSSPCDLTVYSGNEIYIVEYSSDDITKHTPPYNSSFVKSFFGTYAIAHIDDWLYYQNPVKCSGSRGSSVRKITKAGASDQCYRDLLTIKASGMDILESVIYGCSKSPVYGIYTLGDLDWNLVLDITSLLTGAPEGIALLDNGDYLITDGGDDTIKYITSAGVHTISWDLSSFNTSLNGLDWDGSYAWIIDRGDNYLQKVELPNIPLPSVEKKKWCIGRVGVRFVKL